jgi:hypothetical protein
MDGCSSSSIPAFSRHVTIQKERPVHGDLSSVNQMFSMTTITSGNFFNMNCDDVDYSTAHTHSYLVAGLNDYRSQFHYCLWLFGEVFSLKNLQSSFTGLNQDYLGASSVHMRNYLEINLR